MISNLSKKELRWKYTDYSFIEKFLKKEDKKSKKRIGALNQERALNALELGLGINQRGYNIFVVGASGTGKTSTVENIVYEKAAKEQDATDLVLLFNFEDKDRPLAVNLPTSLGPKLKKSYDLLMEKSFLALERAFETDSYFMARQVIDDTCRAQTKEALRDVEIQAQKNGFLLTNTGMAITITPSNKKGENLSEEEFYKLKDSEKKALEKKAEKLEIMLEDAMRKVRVYEKEGEDAFEELERETGKAAIFPVFEQCKTQWKSHKKIIAHLCAMEEDIVAKIKRFIPEEVPETDAQHMENQVQQRNMHRKKLFDDDEDFDQDEQIFSRYKVNVIVTHKKGVGAPVVFETHPTASNLIGRIEQRIKAGETITDFTRIRAGALYKANGGYLITEASELLRDHGAWEGLKRAIKNRALELDDPGEPGRMITMAALRPEPVALNLKVILIGPPEIYYALAKNDPDFQNLFKVKADFDIEIDLSETSIGQYLTFLKAIKDDEKLLDISSDGAARIIEEAVRMAGRKDKISCRLGEIADLLREANYWASKEKKKLISSSHITLALNAREEREGFIEHQLLDDIKDGKVNIDTRGKVVGQANALTVVEVGNYEFGIPLRVTCQIGAGKGEIIDIERETLQSGPFHSKGRMIIRGLLSKLFGSTLTFGFHATLCMEQTYSDVDGDSASMAECCSLLSSLALVPIDQKFALTGAIDQMGHIQAVGGINEKIEGFFKVCQIKQTDQMPGVIIPRAVVSDLMLKDEVLEACEKKRFQIIAVDTIEDAMEALTGIPFDAGKNSLKLKCIKTLEYLNTLRLSKKDSAFLLNGKQTKNNLLLNQDIQRI